MKKLQTNFTTTEQSKRLLELGVPADSADCYNTTKHIGKIPDGATYKDVWQMSIWRDENGNHIEMYPSWSVGRLIELAFILIEKYEDVKHQEWAFCMQGNLIDNCLEMLEAMYNENYDFSKLEE